MGVKAMGPVALLVSRVNHELVHVYGLHRRQAAYLCYRWLGTIERHSKIDWKKLDFKGLVANIHHSWVVSVEREYNNL